MSRLRPLAALPALLFTSSAGAQVASDIWSSARPLTLRLVSFKFEPSEIRLEHGVAYDLQFENTSTGKHDFTGPEFFSSAQIRPEDAAKIHNGSIQLGSGQKVDVHLIAPTPGTYKVHCTHFMHSAMGMTGRIIVQ